MGVRLRSIVVLGLSLAATAISAGCSSGEADEQTAEVDEEIKAVCSVFSVKDGRNLTPAEIDKLQDPVMKRVLAGEGGCPKSFQEIQKKLRTTDAAGCAPDRPNDAPSGVFSRVVSERSQDLGKPDSYRAVVTRDCSGRGTFGLFMSVFGIEGTDNPLPKTTELIGFDGKRSVFNYYEVEGGKWKFFGSSIDLIEDGYDCNKHGACVPKASAKTRCASCHTGGGLVMKELNFPWVHWEGDTVTPGANALFKVHEKLLGGRGDGIELEGRVGQGNAKWNSARLKFLKTKGAKELLRPLFCSVDVNLQTALVTEVQQLTDIPADFFLDSFFTGSGFEGGVPGVPIKAADYVSLMKENNQRIQGLTKGKPAIPVRDSRFPFIFPERGFADTHFVEALIDAKIIDRDFAADVLAVDFTRPVFSPTRCALLAHMPDLEGPDLNPQKIRGALNAALDGKGEAAERLRESLQRPKNVAAHEKAANDFLAACRARPKKALLADAMLYASHLRRVMRSIKGKNGQGIIEFPETLPIDDLPDTDKKFDPQTCELK